MPNIVKKTTIVGLFDLLAPHSCRGCGRIGSPLCDCCKKNILSHHQNVCPICKNPCLNGKCSDCPALPPIFIAGNRSDLIGLLIQDLKFNSVRALAHPLAEILNSIIPPTDVKTIIIPLPTIKKHVRARGLDHTKLIAEHFAKIRPNCKAQNLIIRVSDTVQVGSNRTDRLTQAANAYAINPKIKIDPSVTYIIFDDVWTTGASIQAAYSLLKKAGAKKIIVGLLALSSLN